MGFKNAGLNVGAVDPNRTWIVREYVAGAWTTTSTGVFADLDEFQAGVGIVQPDALIDASSTPTDAPEATLSATESDITDDIDSEDEPSEDSRAVVPKVVPCLLTCLLAC